MRADETPEWCPNSDTSAKHKTTAKVYISRHRIAAHPHKKNETAAVNFSKRHFDRFRSFRFTRGRTGFSFFTYSTSRAAVILCFGEDVEGQPAPHLNAFLTSCILQYPATQYTY